MATARRQIVAWETRYFPPVGLATFVAVALIIAASFVASSITQNGHASDLLTSAHENGSSLFAYSAMQALGYLLLVAPLYFLFRATAARSDRFRRQLVGIAIAAPILFAVSSILTGVVTHGAADKYVNKEASVTMTAKEAATECRKELEDKGKEDFAKEWDGGKSPLADCESTEIADDTAENAVSAEGLHGLSIGFELASRLALAVTLLYTCLYAMRTGLLTRFWGSLGMALGVASLLLAPIFSMIFFIYFAVLAFGKLPGGRPPAWAAGRAIPWPSPGEKAAEELQPEDPSAEVIEAEELPPGSDLEAPEAPEAPEAGSGDEPPKPGGGPRKRKRRS
jgi:hypothetical protein